MVSIIGLVRLPVDDRHREGALEACGSAAARRDRVIGGDTHVGRNPVAHPERTRIDRDVHREIIREISGILTLEKRAVVSRTW